MLLNNKTTKFYQFYHLRQEGHRWQSLFNLTHFDRLVQKHVAKTVDDHGSLGLRPEGFIYSGIVAQALRPASQRDFVDTLTKESVWRVACRFQTTVPDQSSFSRKWNDEAFLPAIEGVFIGSQHLVALKKIPGALKQAQPVLHALQHGY